MEEVKINKIAFGGQGVGELSSGKRVFVWNSLPNEVVKVKITKNKSSFAEGIAEEIIKPSNNRVAPVEPEAYLSTSPWQIVDYRFEAILKQELLEEAFYHLGGPVDWQPFFQNHQQYNYRNKMEYNFWWDNASSSVSLALHKRGSHLKISLDSSALAFESINRTGVELIHFINSKGIEARPLKSVIIRSDQSKKVGVSLFLNDEEVAQDFREFSGKVHAFELIYSNPKSPASVATKYLDGNNNKLQDSVLGYPYIYSTRSFFQVNIPVYEQVLRVIKDKLEQYDGAEVLELYSGVGSIGLSTVPESSMLTMVETSEESTEQAKINSRNRKNCQILTEDAEKLTEYITSEKVVIVDPPRAGLHQKILDELCSKAPKMIIYLSCNPSTQSRDVRALLEAGYEIVYAQGFNFFPHTPHIESLLVLERGGD